MVITGRGSIAPGSVGAGGLVAVLHSLLSLSFHLQVLWFLCDMSSGVPRAFAPPATPCLCSFTLLCTVPLYSGFLLLLFFCKKKKLLLKVKGFRLINRKGRTKKPKPQRGCSVGRQSESPQRAGLGEGLSGGALALKLTRCQAPKC